MCLLETLWKSPACTEKAQLVPGRLPPSTYSLLQHCSAQGPSVSPAQNTFSELRIKASPICLHLSFQTQLLHVPQQTIPCIQTCAKPVARKPFTKAMASLSLCPSIAGGIIPHFYSKKILTNSVLEFQNNNNFKNLSYVRRCHCLSSLSFSRPSSKPSLCFLPP